MTIDPQSAASHPRCRRGFSLLELMIAIVILGIGMVMVATVFPIGLDVARESIQTNMSTGIADCAAATLSLRVPAAKTPNPAPAHVLVPDVAGTDVDTVIDNKDAEALALTIPPRTLSQWVPDPDWPAIGLTLTTPGFTYPDFFTRARSFTERTGWACQGLWQESAVVPSQNLPPAYAALLEKLPPENPTLNDLYAVLPVAVHPSFVPRTHLPRVSLLEQVYPPVRPLNPDGTERGPADVLAEVASRRYAWAAIHCSMSSEPDHPQMLVTAVTLHRADLNARYARQADLNPAPNVYDVTINLDADRDYLRTPWPDADMMTDGLFPRPWLVMLDSINPGNGEVRCTPHVARLLPVGSFFIVAKKAGACQAGEPYRIVSASFNPASTSDAEPGEAILQIGRGSGGAANVAAWVFPPAIRTRGNRAGNVAPTFDSRSPAVWGRYGPDPRQVPVK